MFKILQEEYYIVFDEISKRYIISTNCQDLYATHKTAHAHVAKKFFSKKQAYDFINEIHKHIEIKTEIAEKSDSFFQPEKLKLKVVHMVRKTLIQFVDEVEI